jgi:hypothetical protein
MLYNETKHNILALIGKAKKLASFIEIDFCIVKSSCLFPSLPLLPNLPAQSGKRRNSLQGTLRYKSLGNPKTRIQGKIKKGDTSGE